MSPAQRILALPLVLLALLVQGFTPVAAAAMAARMADPFANLPVCSSVVNGQGDASGAPADHQQLCDACALCSAPVATLAPEVPLLARPLIVRLVERPPVEIVGPRGPPALTPKARGPPTYA